MEAGRPPPHSQRGTQLDSREQANRGAEVDNALLPANHLAHLGRAPDDVRAWLAAYPPLAAFPVPTSPLPGSPGLTVWARVAAARLAGWVERRAR